MTQNEEFITVKLVRSLIGTKEDHRATIKGLGLRRINSTRRLKKTPETLGMIKKVGYLIQVVEA